MNNDNTINFDSVRRSATYSNPVVTGSGSSNGGGTTVKIRDINEAISKTASIAQVVEEGESFLQKYSSDVNDLIGVWSGSDAVVHINHLKEVYTWNKSMLQTALAVGAQAYQNMERMALTIEANGGDYYSLPGIAAFNKSNFGQEIGSPNQSNGIDFNGEAADKIHQELVKDFSIFEDFSNHYSSVTSDILYLWEAGGNREGFIEDINNYKKSIATFHENYQAALKALRQAIDNWLTSSKGV